MKRDSFLLRASARLQVGKLVSLTLATVLSFPAALAVPAGNPSHSKRTTNLESALLGTLIEVNTTSDANNVNPSAGCDVDASTPGNQCSLRAAIQYANAVAGDDEIRFNIPLTEPNCSVASNSCFLYLTDTLPPLATNVRIIGPGTDKLSIRRSTGGDYRLLTVTSATDVTISGVVLSSGRPAGVNVGGAIANAGNATINIVDSVISNNVAGADGGDGGAIANAADGTINIINTLITDNRASVPVVDGASGGGGAILNSGNGTVNITNSVLADNKVQGGRIGSANRGGAIYNTSSGTVNIAASAILHNTVTLSTAANSTGGGAGIANAAGGTVTITNSVFADNLVTGGDSGTSVLTGGGVLNVAAGNVEIVSTILSNNITLGGAGASGGGGIFNASGTVNVSNSTIMGNRGLGGGIKGQATLKNTIVAKNNLGPFAGSDVSGTFTSAGFNLIGVEDGGTGFSNATDLKGTATAPLDPKLDPNGAELTFFGTAITVPGIPLCGSPVIDKGSSVGLSSSLITDIRGAGFPRNVDDPNIANAGDGADIGAIERQTACVQSIFVVNNTADSDDVTPGDGNCDSDAVTTGSQCSLRTALREANAVGGDYTINFAIPTSDPGYDPATGRYTINLGGVLPEITKSNLTINGPGADKLIVRRNSGGFYRIFTFGGVVETASLSGLTISNGFNSLGDGGAISFTGKTLNVSGAAFNGNTSAGSGGAIYASVSTKMNVSNSSFTGNFSSATVGLVGGGGIYVHGPLRVTNTTFAENVASGNGGAITAESMNTTTDSPISDCRFTGNSADAGGAIAVINSGSAMNVTRGVFKQNSSTLINNKGGAIFHLGGTLNVIGSTINGSENGGIAIGNGAVTTTIIESTISGNTGAGVLTEDAASASNRFLNVVNTTISDNTGGPGVKLTKINLNVTNSTITRNEGGGILRTISQDPGTWTLKSNIIAGNGSGFGDVLGTFTSGGFNVIGIGDNATGVANGINNDQVGTFASPLDARLDPAGLQDHGGPTLTIALQPDSPAIDRGTANGLTGALSFDQRGTFARVYDQQAVANAADGTDAGAFELQPGGPTPTPTPTPTPSPSPNPTPTPSPSPSPSPTPSPSPSPTPTPTPSPTPTPAPSGPKLVVTTTTLLRTNCGDIVVGITVQNTGGTTAANVRLTAATLSSPTTNGSPLPQSLGNLAAGKWTTVLVTFSGRNNPAGAKRTLQVEGSFNGGVFADKWKLNLP